MDIKTINSILSAVILFYLFNIAFNSTKHLPNQNRQAFKEKIRLLTIEQRIHWENLSSSIRAAADEKIQQVMDAKNNSATRIERETQKILEYELNSILSHNPIQKAKAQAIDAKYTESKPK